MKILVACEESQRVCWMFRLVGHEAYSCDIIECSGKFSQWHIKDDVTKYLNGKCWVVTMDSQIRYIDKWDMIIGFPPCTYLTVTGNRWFNVERYGQKAIDRQTDRQTAITFFMKIANADCKRIAIENPVGVMSTTWRKPDQIIHPYMFGDKARKATCLWLKGLPKLEPTNIVEPEIIKYKNGKGTDNPWHMKTMSLPPAERARQRSKTFWGIARAMADQWG